MSDLVELEQAAHLHRAEDRWLDQCADRLRRAASAQSAAGTPNNAADPADTTDAEVVR